jgi:hypothetical protein
MPDTDDEVDLILQRGKLSTQMAQRLGPPQSMRVTPLRKGCCHEGVRGIIFGGFSRGLIGQCWRELGVWPPRRPRMATVGEKLST